MTGAEARVAVQAAFDVKVSFYFHDYAWAVKPAKFGAYLGAGEHGVPAAQLADQVEDRGVRQAGRAGHGRYRSE